MGNKVDNKFTWTIRNFSSLESKEVCSDQFVIGGCKWNLTVFPKGDDEVGYLSLYLEVANDGSLACGWRRRAKFPFTLVNRLSERLSQIFETQQWLEEYSLSWGFFDMILITKLHKRGSGFLVNGELKITVEIVVLEEVIGRLDETEESEEETTQSLKKRKQDSDDMLSSDLLNKTQQLKEVNGFLVLPSQVESVKRIFEKHQDIASGVRTKSQHLRTTYINVILGLIETMCQSPHDLSDDDLKEASTTLSYAVNIGFKLDWLEKKLTELCEKKTKMNTVESRLPEMEQELQNLNKKRLDLNALLEKSKAEVAEAKIPLSFDDIV